MESWALLHSVQEHIGYKTPSRMSFLYRGCTVSPIWTWSKGMKLTGTHTDPEQFLPSSLSANISPPAQASKAVMKLACYA